MRVTTNNISLQTVQDLLEGFEDGKDILHNGRNVVKRFVLTTGNIVIIKRFAIPNMFRKVGNLFQGTKCSRAFRNALLLREKGIMTPAVLAMAENGPGGYDYLITEPDYGIPLAECMTDDHEGQRVAEAFAVFVLGMHTAGLLHLDFNNTNIRVSKSAENISFSLIDVNRMKNVGKKPNFDDRMENLFRFSALTPFFIKVIEAYLRQSGEYIPQNVEIVMIRKQRHDASWTERKRLNRRFKRMFFFARKS